MGKGIEGTRYLHDGHTGRFDVKVSGPHSVAEGLRTIDEMVRCFVPNPDALDSFTVIVEDKSRDIGKVHFKNGQSDTFNLIRLRVPVTFHATADGLAFRSKNGAVLMDWCDLPSGEGHRQIVINAVMLRNEAAGVTMSAPMTLRITEIAREARKQIEAERDLLKSAVPESLPIPPNAKGDWTVSQFYKYMRPPIHDRPFDKSVITRYAKIALGMNDDPVNWELVMNEEEATNCYNMLLKVPRRQNKKRN